MMLTPMMTRAFHLRVLGNWSRMEVDTVSTRANSESRPSVINMMKNRMAQSGETGREVTADGYTTNAKVTPTTNGSEIEYFGDCRWMLSHFQ